MTRTAALITHHLTERPKGVLALKTTCGRGRNMPASLKGLAKYWYYDEVVKGRVQQDGFSGLVQKEVKGQALVKKDAWHAVHNRALVTPIIFMMKNQHLLKTPYLRDLDYQVATLTVLLEEKPVRKDHIEHALCAYEIDIHLTSSSIKKILGFLRKKYLAPHVPWDMGF